MGRSIQCCVCAVAATPDYKLNCRSLDANPELRCRNQGVGSRGEEGRAKAFFDIQHLSGIKSYAMFHESCTRGHIMRRARTLFDNYSFLVFK